MARKRIDRPDDASEMNCTVALPAESEMEIVDAEKRQAAPAPEHENSPDPCRQMRSMIRDGSARTGCRRLAGRAGRAGATRPDLP
jgi:hypothetical protein